MNSNQLTLRQRRALTKHGQHYNEPTNKLVHRPKTSYDPSADIHGSYFSNARRWRRARHIMLGEDAIKENGTTYLPKLNSQSHTEYSEYLHRGFFYNATARTVSGYLGLIFRKDPQISFPY